VEDIGNIQIRECFGEVQDQLDSIVLRICIFFVWVLGMLRVEWKKFLVPLCLSASRRNRIGDFW